MRKLRHIFTPMDMLNTCFVSPSYLNYSFLGEANGIRVSKGSASSVAFMRKSAKGKESQLGKPNTMASSMTLTRVNPSLKVKSSLRKLAITSPENVNVDREHFEFLGMRKLMDARTNRTFSLYRYICLAFSIYVLCSFALCCFFPFSFLCILLYIV